MLKNLDNKTIDYSQSENKNNFANSLANISKWSKSTHDLKYSKTHPQPIHTFEHAQVSEGVVEKLNF